MVGETRITSFLILFYQRNLMFTILLPLFSTVSHRMVSFSVRGTHYQTKRKMVSLSLIECLPLQAQFPITHLNFTTFIWYSLVNKCSHSKNLSSLKKFLINLFKRNNQIHGYNTKGVPTTFVYLYEEQIFGNFPFSIKIQSFSTFLPLRSQALHLLNPLRKKVKIVIFNNY